MKYCSLLAVLSILAMLGVDTEASHDVADISAGQVYWNKALPNTPIPSAIKELMTTMQSDKSKDKRSAFIGANEGVYQIYHGKGGIETDAREKSNTTLFFLEKDLQPGCKSTWQFSRTTSSGATLFISRDEANSIPFTSTKFLDILRRFSVQPSSAEAKSMKQTLQECEKPAMDGESKYCATSLESMVEFSMARIGTRNIQAMSTEVELDKDKKRIVKSATKLQQYTVTSSSRLKSGPVNLVACHAESYAYAVFYCHTILDAKAYQVKLVGKDMTKVETMAVCHTNTAKWNPKHIAFRLLHVKPGTVPVCHFLAQESLVWAPKFK